MLRILLLVYPTNKNYLEIKINILFRFDLLIKQKSL